MSVPRGLHLLTDASRPHVAPSGRDGKIYFVALLKIQNVRGRFAR